MRQNNGIAFKKKIRKLCLCIGPNTTVYLFMKSNCFYGFMYSLGFSIVVHAFSKEILDNHCDFPSSWSSPGIITGSVCFLLI